MLAQSLSRFSKNFFKHRIAFEFTMETDPFENSIQLLLHQPSDEGQSIESSHALDELRQTIHELSGKIDKISSTLGAVDK